MFINNVIPAWLGEELLKVKRTAIPNSSFGLRTLRLKVRRRISRNSIVGCSRKQASRAVLTTSGILTPSNSLKAGIDIRTVSKALGHSSVTVTERFYSRWCSGQQNNLDETLSKALGQ